MQMPSPWKDPRTGTYKVRRKIPDRLKDHMPNGRHGKSWWVQTLGTKNAKEAKRLFTEVLADCDRDFQIAESRLASQDFVLTPRHAQSLAAQWLKQRIEKQQSTPDLLEIEEAQMDIHDALKKNIGTESWEALAARVATENDLPLDEEACRKLSYELIWADHEFWRMMLTRRKTSELPESNNAKVELKAIDETIRLPEIFDKWALETQPNVRRKADIRRRMNEFIGMYGDIPVSQITPRQIVDWKDSLVSDGRAPNYVSKKMSDFRVLLKQAVRDKYISINPGEGVSSGTKAVRKPRLSFEDSDINAILEGPVHGHGARPTRGCGEAAYWIPLISMYGGFRLGEIAQLIRSDVIEVNGVLSFDINERGDKTAKNPNSIRRVPVHQRLIDRGFVEFVKGQPEKLFPEVKPKGGQQAAKWGEWFNNYLREEIGVEGNKTFHSFRHTFIDRAKRAGIDGDLWRKITGHSPQDVGGGYGNDELIQKLKVEIDKVSY